MLPQLTGKARPGVGQYAHPHQLLRRGLNILDELFACDFEAGLVSAGAQQINWLLDADIFISNCMAEHTYIPGPHGSEQVHPWT